MQWPLREPRYAEACPVVDGWSSFESYEPVKSKAAGRKAILPRLRVLVGKDIALGPGKVELLAFVHKTGSIGEAAKAMGMSYMRAWVLIKTMQRCFKKPLVHPVRGGAGGGGAELTETGRAALALYQQMDNACLKATRQQWLKLQRLLRS